MGGAIKTLLRTPLRWRALNRERRYGASAPHELAVCAIFKDEADFLEEWVTFHAGVGVTRFYLYDNGSRDGGANVLAPFVKNGLVSVTSWPHSPGQRSAYLDCLRRHWREAKRIAFIDIDEFLFSPAQVDIRPILRRFESVPALFVHGICFGASGHVARPPGLLLDAFTWSEEPSRARSGKSIVNPRLVRNVSQSHVFPCWAGATVNTRGDSIPSVPVPEAVLPCFDLLQLNHYWSRSIDDLTHKVERGDAFYGTPRDLETHLRAELRMNDVQNSAISSVRKAIFGSPDLS